MPFVVKCEVSSIQLSNKTFYMEDGTVGDPGSYYLNHYWSVGPGGSLPLNFKMFATFDDALNNLITLFTTYAPAFMGDPSFFDIFIVETKRATETTVIHNGKLLYQAPNKSTSSQTPVKNNYTPGESLKKYRNGGDVDWVELAKHYGGQD